MFNRFSSLLLVCAAMAGSVPLPAQEGQPAPMGPAEAIAAAADAPRTGARGLFIMRVASTGRGGRRVFLNSERDYRHRDNLSVEVLPSVVRALASRHGGANEDALVGRRIEVRGRARRIPIRLSEYQRTVGYYFQTRIVVTEADQIRVIG